MKNKPSIFFKLFLSKMVEALENPQSNGSSVKVQFIAKNIKYKLNDNHILVPTKLSQKGLSEIINHLLAKSGIIF